MYVSGVRLPDAIWRSEHLRGPLAEASRVDRDRGQRRRDLPASRVVEAVTAMSRPGHHALAAIASMAPIATTSLKHTTAVGHSRRASRLDIAVNPPSLLGIDSSMSAGSARSPASSSARVKPAIRSLRTAMGSMPPRKAILRCPREIRCAVTRAAPAVIVGRHERCAGTRHAPDGQDERHAEIEQVVDLPPLGLERRTEDDPRRAVLAHRAHDLGLPDDALGRVGNERNVARRAQDAFDPDGELGEERVRQVIDDHADDARLRTAQVGRAAVVDVAELGHRLRHAVAGLVGHEGAALEHQATRSIWRRLPRERCR